MIERKQFNHIDSGFNLNEIMAMKLVSRLLLAICILFIHILPAKPPELTPEITRKKIEEFLNAHIVHKELNSELIQKMLQNYISHLDPSKTYLIKSEIEHFEKPSATDLEHIKNNILKNNYTFFKEVYETMVSAIERRNSLEQRIKETPLPKGVKISEFSNMSWAESEDELLDRLLRIKGLQSETAEKFNPDAKELLFKRLEKSRLGKEGELLGKNKSEKEAITLSFVLKALASALDAHTVYFTPSEANQFMIQIQQKLYGIGAQLRDDLNGLTIVSLLEGGPAQQSNLLKPGDRIVAVNKEPIIGMEISEAVELIRGPENSQVILTIVRQYDDEKEEKKEKTLDIQISRKEVVLAESRYHVDTEPFGPGVIGVIRLFSFYQDMTTSSALDIKKEIEKLKQNHHLLGVILDLRSNAGGLLTQAVEVAGLFIGKGIVASIKDCMGNIQHFRNFESSKTFDGPVLVLTNAASASAAEIVAQSLQDYGRAFVVGDKKTYGKGSYQQFTLDANHSGKVNPQGEFKVTRGMYYTVSGKSPQHTGVEADIEIPGPLSHAEIGERFAKNALQTASIKPNFEDDLSDIHPLHRFKIRSIYGSNLEKKSDHLQAFYSKLKINSKMRQEKNSNYKAFLEELKKDDDLKVEHARHYGENDLQLEEALNVMKDFVMMQYNKPLAKAS